MQRRDSRELGAKLALAGVGVLYVSLGQPNRWAKIVIATVVTIATIDQIACSFMGHEFEYEHPGRLHLATGLMTASTAVCLTQALANPPP